MGVHKKTTFISGMTVLVAICFLALSDGSMNANPILLQKKYARAIEEFAQKAGIYT